LKAYPTPVSTEPEPLQSEATKPPVVPEGQEAHDLAEKLLSEQMVVPIALGIFLALVVLFEWRTVWDAIVMLWPGAKAP
jgi:hypothetical protein